MSTKTFYRLMRSTDGGQTWKDSSYVVLEGVAREWYDDEVRWWLPDDPQRRLKLVRVTVTETEEIVASTEQTP